MSRAAFYDGLSAEKKKGFTRPSIVSCKRVPKEGNYSVYRACIDLSNKGAVITDLTIDFSPRRHIRSNEVVGHKTKAKVHFLTKHHGYTVVGL